MSCARSSSGAGARDPGSKLGSTSLTCSSSTCSKISGGWIEKSIGGSRVIIEGICDLFGRSSLT